MYVQYNENVVRVRENVVVTIIWENSNQIMDWIIKIRNGDQIREEREY